MKLRAGRIWLIAVLGLLGQARGGESSDPALATVRTALARADQVKLAHWAYNVTAVIDGEEIQENHDPSRGPQRWRLLRKEGKEPSDKEQKKYAEDRRRRGPGMSSRKLGDLIDRSSLQVESQDALQIRCSFKLKVSDEDVRFVIEKLRGTLTVLREPATLKAVEVINTERISKPGVLSLSEIRVQAQYQPDPVRGDPVLHSCSSRIRGRVLLVKSINSDTQLTYSGHRWVGSEGIPESKPTTSKSKSTRQP